MKKSWNGVFEFLWEPCNFIILIIAEPGKHISLLFAKWESAIGEKDRLVKQMAEMEKKFKEDLHEQLNSQKTDSESRISDAVEAARLECRFDFDIVMTSLSLIIP